MTTAVALAVPDIGGVQRMNNFIKPVSIPKNYDGRSRSRDEVPDRGEQYGRGSKDNTRGDRQEKGDTVTEMHGGKHQGGGGGYNGGYGGRGGYGERDSREGGGGGGYRDRGGQRDRGGDFGRGRGGPGGGFGGGAKTSTVNEGQTAVMQSNHFRFGVSSFKG